MTPATVPVAILCGGLGTRLATVSGGRPKTLMPVLGAPFLRHQLELVAGQGFRRFVLLTGHGGDQVEAWARGAVPPPLALTFSRETEPLGTGGALLKARPFLDVPFLLLNGDSYLELDYAALLANLLAAPASIVAVLAAWRAPQASAAVEASNLALAPGGAVLAYSKRGSDPRLSHVDAGAGAYRPSVFELFGEAGEGPLSLEESIWPRAIAAGRVLSHAAPAQPWDIGTPDRLAAFEAHLSARGVRA